MKEIEVYLVCEIVISKLPPLSPEKLLRASVNATEHFLSQPNHCHTDMQLIPLEVIHSSRDSIRKARESFLIDLAGTLEPHSLNRRDEL